MVKNIYIKFRPNTNVYANNINVIYIPKIICQDRYLNLYINKNYAVTLHNFYFVQLHKISASANLDLLYLCCVKHTYLRHKNSRAGKYRYSYIIEGYRI